MSKLSDYQKNEIRKLFPLNPQLSYDKHDEDSIFNQLEHVLKNSCVSTNVTTTSTKKHMGDQIKTLETIKADLGRIQRGIQKLTPTNQHNLNDAFSFDIFSEIKASREKQSGESEPGMEWHHLNMEAIFSALSFKAQALIDHMEANFNTDLLFHQNLCDFWESQRLKHADIRYSPKDKYVRIAAILLNKDASNVKGDVWMLKIKDWPDTHIYIE